MNLVSNVPFLVYAKKSWNWFSEYRNTSSIKGEYLENMLNDPEKQGLNRVRSIMDKIVDREKCKTLNIEVANNPHEFCYVRGNSSNLVLLFDKTFLNKLGTEELTDTDFCDWNNYIDTLPQNIHDIKSIINNLSNEELLSLSNTYIKYLRQWTDEEIYFALRHELLGHSENKDNDKKLLLRIGTIASSYFGLSHFVSTGYPLMDALIVILGQHAITETVSSKLYFWQELQADKQGVKNDRVALLGAQRFFKKRIVFNFVSESYFKKTGIKLDQLNILDRIQGLLNLGDPSAVYRYENIQKTVSE